MLLCWRALEQPLLAENIRPYKIGILAPLTGEMAAFGNKALEGVRLAEKEFSPKQIRFILEDVGSGTSNALVTATEKLVSVDKIDLLLGLIYIDQTLIVAPITERAQIPFFSLTLCSDQLRRFSRVACGYPASELQLQPIVPLFDTLKLRSLAIVSDQSKYASEVLQILKQSLPPQGIQITRVEEISQGSTDFRSLLPKLLASNPDAVFGVTMDPRQSFALFQQLNIQSYAGVRIGYLDVDPKYIQEFGPSIEGIYLPGFIAPVYAPHYVSAYEKSYSRPPNAYAAQAYDVSRAALRGLVLGSTSPGDAYKRILNNEYADPAIPGFRFTTQGTVQLPTSILQIRGGKFVDSAGREFQ